MVKFFMPPPIHQLRKELLFRYTYNSIISLTR